MGIDCGERMAAVAGRSESRPEVGLLAFAGIELSSQLSLGVERLDGPALATCAGVAVGASRFMAALLPIARRHHYHRRVLVIECEARGLLRGRLASSYLKVRKSYKRLNEIIEMILS